MTSWRLVWNFIFFLLRGGFRKHEENKKGDLGGANLRLAQFYKDVEMAEVMTDNDHAVAEILASPPPSLAVGCEKTIEQLRIAAPGFLPCRRAAVLQTKPTRGAASSLVLVPLSVSVYDCILVNTH